MGDAVSDVLARTRGQSSAGIFIITDGQSNAGRSLVAAAEQAKIENVPLYVYGVGIAQPRDIIVSNLFTRDVAFVGDELPVNVRVRGLGLAGETATVTLQPQRRAGRDAANHLRRGRRADGAHEVHP